MFKHPVYSTLIHTIDRCGHVLGQCSMIQTSMKTTGPSSLIASLTKMDKLLLQENQSAKRKI